MRLLWTASWTKKVFMLDEPSIRRGLDDMTMDFDIKAKDIQMYEEMYLNLYQIISQYLRAL